MDLPRGSGRSCKNHKNVATQTSDSKKSPESNPRTTCCICGNQRLSESSPNEIPIGSNLPDSICQCFLMSYDNNIPGGSNFGVLEGSFLNEKNTRQSTPVSSGKSFKSSPSTEKTISSSGYALSVLEQSSDQDSSDQINAESSSPESRNSSNPEKGVSSGYALSLGEQSSDENLTKNISPRLSEDLKGNSKTENDESCTQNLYESSYLEQVNVNEYKSNKSFSSNQTEISYNWTRIESDGQSELKSNRNENIHKSIPPELVQFRSPHPRPECPRPFPSLQVTAHLPNRNIAMNMPILGPSLPRPHHHTLSTQPYNPAINVPINRTNFPGRFPVVPRPQIISHHQRSGNNGNGNFSQKLLTESKKEDTEENCVKKVERIENWLEDLENALPFEDFSASAYATSWSTVQNDDEAILEWVLETSTDERSSTEISEEEYRKQMAEKRPPRKNKKK